MSVMEPVPERGRDGPGRGLAPYATPAVRRFARELGVDPGRVRGSGAGGRILQEDVRAFVRLALARAAAPAPTPPSAAAPERRAGPDLPPWPEVDFARFGPVERQPLSRLKRIAGPNLARNWVTIPHVTSFDEAEVTDLEAFRLELNKEQAKAGVKVTMLAFLIKAMAACLRHFPGFNASLQGGELVLKRYVHIGFAADTPGGLVVPVVWDADRKGLLEIAAETAALAGAAREGRLRPADMQGGCLTISSLGGIGGTGFTPIINAPEVAILGVARAAMKPAWNGAAFVPRLLLPLALSWDHRVIDGAEAGRFLAHLAALLADFRQVAL